MDISDLVQPLMLGRIRQIAREESHAAYILAVVEHSVSGLPELTEREEQKAFSREQSGYRALNAVDAISWLIEASGALLSVVGVLAWHYGSGSAEYIWKPGLAAAGAAVFRHAVVYAEERALKRHNERIAELRLYNEILPE